MQDGAAGLVRVQVEGRGVRVQEQGAEQGLEEQQDGGGAHCVRPVGGVATGDGENGDDNPGAAAGVGEPRSQCTVCAMGSHASPSPPSQPPPRARVCAHPMMLPDEALQAQMPNTAPLSRLANQLPTTATFEGQPDDCTMPLMPHTTA